MPEQKRTFDPSVRIGFLSFIEAVVNKSLALDPVTIKRLSQYEGAVIQVDCIEPEFVAWLWIENDGIRLAAFHESSVDVRVSGTLVSYMELAARRQAACADIAGLETSGDQKLLTELEVIHKDMELDWEALVCRYLGDVAGHGLASGIRSVSESVRSFFQRGFAQIPEYLQEELNVLPAAAAANSFQDQLERLKTSVDRLSGKISDLGRSDKALIATGLILRSFAAN